MPTDDGVPPPHDRHRLYEDALAMLLGTLLVALGVTFYTKAMLLTGSTAGIALLVSYVSRFSFGAIFFVINLPFYILAFRRMGWRFTLKTFIAVALVSLFSRLTPGWVSFARLDDLYAAIIGGALSGIGLLMLFRHRAGLGGINILALYLQDHHGIRAGYFQLAVDGVILACALMVLPIDKVILSMIGAAVLNLILAMNHKPGRYMGIS
ncbi:YitT family protein [Kaistia dalseonensis]|uniref:Uncharacterized membrane-anchored protein YitT (DUF2179 family) n=1 Tax=Kaistia dalseonensis TaxID=410840 RepID=A0ABU0H0W4_9HYPH|nr:YitT family protein [Kaistia dalseonensis]MCX5493392.1 YitT family protein [Kaistia dalseonensis]MDQ0435950.1 uncharacterized membrane-anchored protein YitT (DUF2179 family) [Kaistia dalseonensis]